MPVITTKDQTKSIFAAMRRLTEQEVLIGIPFENAPRSNAEDKARKTSGEPINNAEIGYINELGLPEKNIPARPHLVPGIADVKKRLGEVLADGAKKVLQGKADAGDAALTKAGLIAETSVKARITDGLSPALAPATLEQRKRRGRTGETPLLDTADYLKSITFVVRKKDRRKNGR